MPLLALLKAHFKQSPTTQCIRGHSLQQSCPGGLLQEWLAQVIARQSMGCQCPSVPTTFSVNTGSLLLVQKGHWWSIFCLVVSCSSHSCSSAQHFYMSACKRSAACAWLSCQHCTLKTNSVTHRQGLTYFARGHALLSGVLDILSCKPAPVTDVPLSLAMHSCTASCHRDLSPVCICPCVLLYFRNCLNGHNSVQMGY